MSSQLETVPLWINGRNVTSSDLKRFPVVSAKNKDKILHYALSADVSSAIAACDSASVAFQTWKNTSAVERRDLLIKAADLIVERKAALVKVQMEETSSSEFWAGLNVTAAAGHIREFASRITALSGVIPQSKLDYAESHWNAPLILGLRAVVNPLAAGCTVVLKASELSPKTHHMMVQALFDAGIPVDAVSIVQADREDAPGVTEALIAHPAVRKVEFIGSAPVGRIIGSLAGKYLKPVLMELGGKCGLIVLEDADLEDAALKCIVAAYNHHGQVCFSTDRIYVIRSVAEQFIKLPKAYAESFPAGGAASQHLAHSAAAKLLDAEKKGARFLLGSPGFKDESSATLTLGGAKNSGWGRTNGQWGLEEFSVLKLVTVTMRPGLPSW